MNIRNRATDLMSLRKMARVAVIAAVGALLAMQVVSAAPPPIPCPLNCQLQLQTCGNACTASFNFEVSQCVAAESTCELICVLSGFSFGPALTQCVNACHTSTLNPCLAAAQGHLTTCVATCQTSFGICNLICNLLSSLGISS